MSPGRRFQLRLLFSATGLIAGVGQNFASEPYKTALVVVASFWIGWGMLYFTVFPWAVTNANGRGVVRFSVEMYRELNLPMCPHCGNGIEKGQAGAAAHAILRGGDRACSVNAR